MFVRILKKGKKMNRIVKVLFVMLVAIIAGCQPASNDKNLKKLKAEIKTIKEDKMEHLTKETFQKKVFNYEVNKEWKYEGDLPCLIDFYADWCGPCKMVAPVLEELAKEYEGKIHIYKVDTEAQQELAAAFGIRSIPSLLFCPKEGQPQMAQGALPKASMEKAIKEILLVEKEVEVN
jgi:thioredoxin